MRYLSNKRQQVPILDAVRRPGAAIVLALLLCILADLACGENPVEPAYLFPPGIVNSTQWEQVSGAEKRQYLDIPQSVLAAAPTRQLLQWYCDCYQFSGLIIRDQAQWNRLQTQYNVVPAVLARCNLFETILSKLDSIDQAIRDDIRQSSFPYHLTNNLLNQVSQLEMVLSQEMVLTRLNTTDADRVVAACIRRYFFKVYLNLPFAYWFTNTTVLVIARIIIFRPDEHPEYQEFAAPDVQSYVKAGDIPESEKETIVNVAMEALPDWEEY